MIAHYSSVLFRRAVLQLCHRSMDQKSPPVMLDTSLPALAHSHFMVLIPAMALGLLQLQRTVPIHILALHVTHHTMAAEVKGDKSVGAERCMHQPLTNSLPAEIHMCAATHDSIRRLCSSAFTEL